MEVFLCQFKEKEENSALIFKKANFNYIESQIMR